MNRFFIVPAVVLSVLVTSCNSNADTPTEDKVDSLITKTDTSMHHDMAMGNVEPVPEIPAGAKVYFKNLKSGQSVSSPVKIAMGAAGIKVDTAGALKAGSGHHHLLIDAGDSIASGAVVGKDSTHIHFGKAQTEATIPLTPGKHILTLQFADGIHRSYGNRLSSSIVVNVKK